MLNRELDIFCTNYSSFSHSITKPRGPHTGWFQFSKRNGRNTNVNVNRLKRKYGEMNGVRYLTAVVPPRVAPPVVPPTGTAGAPRVVPPLVSPGTSTFAPPVVPPTGTAGTSTVPTGSVKKKRKLNIINIAYKAAKKFGKNILNWFQRLWERIKDFVTSFKKRLKNLRETTVEQTNDVRKIFEERSDLITLKLNNNLVLDKKLPPLTLFNYLNDAGIDFRDVYIFYNAIKGDETLDIVEFVKIQHFSKIVQNLNDPELFFSILNEQNDKNIFNNIFDVEGNEKGNIKVFKYVLTILKREIKKDGDNFLLERSNNLEYYARINAILLILQKSKNKIKWKDLRTVKVDKQTTDFVDGFINDLTMLFNGLEIREEHEDLEEVMFPDESVSETSSVIEPLDFEGVEETKEREFLDIQIKKMDVPDIIADDVDKILKVFKEFALNLYEDTADEKLFKNFTDILSKIYEEDGSDINKKGVNIINEILNRINNLFDKGNDFSIKELNEETNKILNTGQKQIVNNLKERKQLESIASFIPKNLDSLRTFTENNVDVFDEKPTQTFYEIWKTIIDFETKITDSKNLLMFVSLKDIFDENKKNNLVKFKKSMATEYDSLYVNNIKKLLETFSKLTQQILTKQIQDKLKPIIENCFNKITKTENIVDDLKNFIKNINFIDFTLDDSLDILDNLESESEDQTFISKNVFNELEDKLREDYRIINKDMEIKDDLTKDIKTLLNNLNKTDLKEYFDKNYFTIDKLKIFKYLLGFVKYKNRSFIKRDSEINNFKLYKNAEIKKLQEFDNEFTNFYNDYEEDDEFRNKIIDFYNQYKENNTIIDLFDTSIKKLEKIEALKTKENYKELATITERNENTLIFDNFIKKVNTFAKSKLREIQLKKERENVERERKAREEAEKERIRLQRENVERERKAREEAEKERIRLQKEEAKRRAREKRKQKKKQFQDLKNEILKVLQTGEDDTETIINLKYIYIKEVNNINTIDGLKRIKLQIDDALNRIIKEENDRLEREARKEALKVKQYKGKIKNIKDNYKNLYKFDVNLEVLNTIENGLKSTTLKDSEKNKDLLIKDMKKRINVLKIKFNQPDLDPKDLDFDNLKLILLRFETRRARNIAATDIQKVVRGGLDRKQIARMSKYKELLKEIQNLYKLNYEEEIDLDVIKIIKNGLNTKTFQEYKTNRDQLKDQIKKRIIFLRNKLEQKGDDIDDLDLKYLVDILKTLENKRAKQIKYTKEKKKSDKINEIFKKLKILSKTYDNKKLLSDINKVLNMYKQSYLRRNKPVYLTNDLDKLTRQYNEIITLKDNIDQEEEEQLKLKELHKEIKESVQSFKTETLKYLINNESREFLYILKFLLKYKTEKDPNEEFIKDANNLKFINKVVEYIRKNILKLNQIINKNKLPKKELSKSGRAKQKFAKQKLRKKTPTGSTAKRKRLKRNQNIKKLYELKAKKENEEKEKRFFDDVIRNISVEKLEEIREKITITEYNFLYNYFNQTNEESRRGLIENFKLGSPVDLPLFNFTEKLQQTLREMSEKRTVEKPKRNIRKGFVAGKDKDLTESIPTITREVVDKVLEDEAPTSLNNEERETNVFEDSDIIVENLEI